jgi:hypothetical protein
MAVVDTYIFVQHVTCGPFGEQLTANCLFITQTRNVYACQRVCRRGMRAWMQGELVRQRMVGDVVVYIHHAYAYGKGG